ncbi:hypothetical protein [Thalassospira lucentensis]|jgi:hypothetical protein|uniref:Uncharacterized protein n=1 Tax=Thalassospira lucentensis TaxID=168935 RepID=A0A358HYE5_9PROT|nr:hypothetical protein [Thalassospira lucentensis]HBV00197.1 hypothetical protein [Thalassospira lucentensis]HCW68913.1 hypothetical protein [Thalassospira lucentensis]
MEKTTSVRPDVRLPDYAQTPLPGHTGHTDIIDFLIADCDIPHWLRADLHGQGRYRPARGAIPAVLSVRERFNGQHLPVSFDELHRGLSELSRHLPGPDQTKVEIDAKVKIYWRYLQGVERQVWRAAVSTAHLNMDHFPVVREFKALIEQVVASRNWLEHRLEVVEQSFQRPTGPANDAVRKALMRLRRMSPGDRLQMFNKARMRRPELRNIDMREPDKWADLVTSDLGLSQS